MTAPVTDTDLKGLALLRSLLLGAEATASGLARATGLPEVQADAFLKEVPTQAWLQPGADGRLTWTASGRAAALGVLQDRLPVPSRSKYRRKECPHTVALATMGRWDALLAEALDAVETGERTMDDTLIEALDRMANLVALVSFQCDVQPLTDPDDLAQATTIFERFKQIWKEAHRPFFEAYNAEIERRGMIFPELRHFRRTRS